MAHYFTNEDLKSDIHKFHTKVLGSDFSFFTDNGVFSKEKLDFGTRLLLENIPYEKFYGEVLDLGCGYGPIGIVLKKCCNASITMCDINRRALHLAERNAKENKVDVTILESDCYQNIGLKKFQYIVTNPPIRAGKKKVYEMLVGAKDHLEENGSLFFVVRKDQGAKSMICDLEKYYTVSVLEKKNGFFVICCDLS